MSRPVTALPNLGPKMAEAFARAGIRTAEEIEALGAEAACARLLAAGHRAHFMAFVALVMGLQGRRWDAPDPAEKAALRARFDRVVAGADGPDAALERALDRLGLPRGGA